MRLATTKRAQAAAIVLLVLLGSALRLWQYLGRDSLFLDEVAILRNVAARSWLGLIDHPLDYDQLAPPGFLLAEKLVTTLAGWSEYAARLFPMLGSIAAMATFALLARRLLSPWGAIAATCVFATAGPLVFFAAQVKQYSTDVLASCLLLLAATDSTATRGQPRSSAAPRLGALAAIVVWFSQPAVLVIAGICVVLGPDALRRARRPASDGSRPLVAALALGASSACASVLVARRGLTAEGRAFMDRYWAEGFPPHGVIEWLRRPWPLAQASELLGSDGANSFGYPAAPLFVVVLAAGLAVLARRGPAGRLVLAPLLVALAAGVAGQYPFSSRLAFFLVPGFVLALAAAAEQLAASLKHRWATSVVPACLAAVTSYPVLTTLPTYHRNDLRPLLEHLAADRRPDRKLYVYYGAAPAFWYYAPTMGLVDDALVPGGCHPGDPIQYLYELDTLRGARSVVLLINREEPDERADILGYLDTIGVRRSELRSSDHWFTRPTGTKAEAIEYDLSDAGRLRAARADGFALRPHGPAPLIPCAHAPLSMPYTRVHP